MSRIAIVGSRNFRDMAEVRKYVAGLLVNDVVISGGAMGVDRLAVNAAAARGLKVEEYPADWAKHGKAAGFLRNQTIVAVSDRVVAFWDGKSRGTQHTIDTARAKGKPVEIFTEAR